MLSTHARTRTCTVAMCTLVAGLLITTLSIAGASAVPGEIYLERGEYRGILIAVDQQVPYHSDIYDNIKNYFLEASEALFTATSLVSGRRLGDVTILLPKTWPTQGQCQTAGTEIQEEANFIVQRDTRVHGSRPHTLKLDAACGTPGDVTYIPQSFIQDRTVAQQHGVNVGKTLLHEWAHLRYGLFDELDESAHSSSCLYVSRDQIKPIMCSKHLTGHVTVNDAARTCSWSPDSRQQHHVMGSLMYAPQLDSVLTFCNKTGVGLEHNSDVPNPQNDRCGGRSGWEVLMQHPDFKHHSVSAPEVSEGMSVRCIQERELDRMVLVMDISGSMQEEHRILRMQQDVQLFLRSMPCRDTSLAMVEFSGTMDEARITHPLARLDQGDNLDSLLDAIPTSTIDQTCIGCGIRRALELLQQSGRVVDGSVLVIFTDGEETMQPHISEVQQEVLNAGVIVYSIMMREYASNHTLLSLAAATGGKSCIFSNNQHTSYYDCLNAVLHHRSPQTAPNQLLNKVVNLRFRSSHDAPVYVDSGIQDRLTVVITWSTSFLSGCQDTHFSAIAPNGTVVSRVTTDRYKRNDAIRTVSIDASGFQPGRWVIRVDNEDEWEHCEVRILVEARRLLLDCSTGVSPDQQQPVLIYPSVGSTVIRVNPDNDLHENAVKLYTEVLRGTDPVLNATVKAEIESDNGDQWTVDLQDNGVGADGEADDGVYSRYFTNYTGDGTYTVKFDVEGGDSTRVAVNNDTGNASSRYDTLDPFQRTQGSNFFEVVGYNDVDEQDKPDLFPPSGVTDLRVKVVEPEVRVKRNTDNMLLVAMEWTAVEVHDTSPGAHYVVALARDSDTLRNRFERATRMNQNDVHEGSLTSVSPFGTKEKLVLAFHHSSLSTGVYYVALKTVDGGGRKSALSNIGLFTFTSPEVVTAPSAIVTGSPGAEDGGEEGEIDNQGADKSRDKEESSFPTWVYYVIAGLGGLLLIMFFIICCMCCCRSSDKSKSQPRELTVHASFPPGTTNLDEIYCDVTDTATISQEPDIIQQTHSNNSSNAGTPQASISRNTNPITDNPVKPGQSHATWPAKHSNKNGKKRAGIWRTIGKGTFFSELKKKFTTHKTPAPEDTHVLERQWSNPRAPMQNIPYSNPLYGEAHTSHEVVVNNSVIDAPYTIDVHP